MPNHTPDTSDIPTHAGGVVCRVENGRQEYLIITARWCPFIWVLPKGHIKRSEPEERAALREVKEESGIRATISNKIGNAKRTRWNLERQVVAFYLMNFAAVESLNTEGRKIRWVPLEKAIQKVWYRDQQAILKQLSGDP